ncbi:MAG TPA: DUF1972 domain-containing protein [bacterium]|nr:DUF1972 domain-containing protein [bacterium]HOL48967.1 DUF1972 domain-containing protein [bacterium]HPO51198.1 DUF1972 domain-containing protein [bacterium]
MKIAILGIRGIPARYGGFETCAEKIAEYLGKKGHKIFVPCRKYLYPDKPLPGDNIQVCFPFCIRGKITETFSHTFFSMLKTIIWSPDVILLFNAANSPLAIFGKIYGKKFVINVDGFEWKRQKWGFCGKTYFKFASCFSTFIADSIVADSHKIAEYYDSRFHKKSVYIPYGADIFYSKSPEIIKSMGLQPKTYFFNGSRLEPENNQELMIKEFQLANINNVLAISGDIRKKNSYVKNILNIASQQIKFTGPVYEKKAYLELQANSLAYIHGNEVGGTNPALLSAMGCGALILALDVPFNREVLGDCGLYFTKKSGSLANLIKQMVESPEKFSSLGDKARERVKQFYRWDDVIQKYEQLLISVENNG